MGGPPAVQQNYIIIPWAGCRGALPPPIYVPPTIFFRNEFAFICISFTFCRSVHCHNILEANGGLDRPSPASTSCMHVRAVLFVMPVNHSINITVRCAPTKVKKPALQVKKLAGCCCWVEKPDPLLSACFLNAGWLLYSLPAGTVKNLSAKMDQNDLALTNPSWIKMANS